MDDRSTNEIRIAGTFIVSCKRLILTRGWYEYHEIYVLFYDFVLCIFELLPFDFQKVITEIVRAC